jgi:hypothetical protein
MSSSGKLPQYPSIYKNLKFCFYFPVLAALGLGMLEGQREGGVRPYHGGYTVHTYHGHWTLCLRQLCTIIISWQFEETGK